MNRLLPVALLLLGACSHHQPFARGGIDPAGVPGDEAVRARVLLVGDAGRPNAAVLAAVRTWSGRLPDRTSVVFLGDNVYEHGLPDGAATREKAILDAQLAAAASHHTLFVPGNHDWHHGRRGIENQAAYLERRGAAIPGRTVRLRPRGGCPGPVADDTPDGVLLVALDTEWFLRRPRDARGCEPPEFQAGVQALLEAAGDDLIVVVAHHPPWTYGPHGGFLDWRDHLFPLTRLHASAWLPLPGLGTVYALARRLVANPQDAFSGRYRAAHAEVAAAFSGYGGSAPLLFAAGHDHSLQVLGNRPPWDYVLVSGSASAEKLTSVTHGPDTLFAHLAHGFMVLDLHADARIVLRVVRAAGNRVTFARWLADR